MTTSPLDVCASARRCGPVCPENGSVAGLPNTPGGYKNPRESLSRVLLIHHDNPPIQRGPRVSLSTYREYAFFGLLCDHGLTRCILQKPSSSSSSSTRCQCDSPSSALQQLVPARVGLKLNLENSTDEYKSSFISRSIDVVSVVHLLEPCSTCHTYFVRLTCLPPAPGS